jgi:hypothetical protein
MYDAGNVIQIYHHFCTASNYSVTTGFYLILFLRRDVNIFFIVAFFLSLPIAAANITAAYKIRNCTTFTMKYVEIQIARRITLTDITKTSLKPHCPPDGCSNDCIAPECNTTQIQPATQNAEPGNGSEPTDCAKSKIGATSPISVRMVCAAKAFVG